MFDRLTPQVWQMILNATGETLYMVFASGLLAAVFAIPLGVLLFITQPGGIKENPKFYRILSIAVNIGRAIPFVILLFWIIPFTRIIVGSSIVSLVSDCCLCRRYCCIVTLAIQRFSED